MRGAGHPPAEPPCRQLHPLPPRRAARHAHLASGNPSDCMHLRTRREASRDAIATHGRGETTRPGGRPHFLIRAKTGKRRFFALKNDATTAPTTATSNRPEESTTRSPEESTRTTATDEPADRHANDEQNEAGHNPNRMTIRTTETPPKPQTEPQTMKTIAIIAAILATLTGCRAAPPQTVARLDVEAIATTTPNHERADIVARLSVEIR